MFQMKILTSALFSRLLLGKSQTKGQWLALSGIVTGVVLVTTGTSPAAVPPGAGFDAWDVSATVTKISPRNSRHPDSVPMSGGGRIGWRGRIVGMLSYGPISS